MTDPDLDLSSCFNEGGQFAWDNTSLNLFQTCPRKYQYRMIGQWVPRRKSVHLLFGGWYATALENFHTYRAEDMSHDDALARVVHETLVATWMPVYANGEDARLERNPIPGRGTPWVSDHNAKTRETLIRTIIWYVDQFKDDNCETVILSDGSPAVEHSFKLEIADGLFWCGHIDRLVNYAGELFIQDQKTTGSTINPKWFDQWHTDGQMSGYTFAGKIIYGMPVKGVIIDGAQIAMGFSRFERGFTHRTEDQLAEWLDDANYYINEARIAFRVGYFPMNRSSCGNYGGCEFKGVCSRSPDVRKNFLAADFTQGEQWNPLVER